MTSTDARLDQIRGWGPPRAHNARTIAALTTNPGCARRAVMDAAGVDKERLATHIGYPPRFGQSRFAITRGNAFEALVKANGCAELLRLLRERLDLPVDDVGYDDLEAVGDQVSQDVRHARTRSLLARAVAAGEDAGTLFDHPLLRLEVGGRHVYLEPDLIAFRVRGRFHIVEIKSFPVIDGQADPGKVAAAATQSAVYVLALRRLLEELDADPATVSHEVVLVCPENFANRPTATLVDVRKQLAVLRRQLDRLTRVETLVARLPAELTLDLAPDRDGTPTRPADDLVEALGRIDARYAPDCLSTCDLAFFCRHEAHGSTGALGRSVREELGGVDRVDTVLGLAAGTVRPSDDQSEAAALLHAAARLRRECLGGAG
ncbi:MAG TPA: hypothetical protein VF054_06825 [Micromonosporaceae bacterium]